MIETHEPAILDLAVLSLHNAIRRRATWLLEASEPFDLTRMHQVERLMRIAISLTGTGSYRAFVEVHGIPPETTGGPLPGLLSVSLTDMLAARAADHLPGALQGNPEALLAVENEADRILQAENIQLG